MNMKKKDEEWREYEKKLQRNMQRKEDGDRKTEIKKRSENESKITKKSKRVNNKEDKKAEGKQEEQEII